MVLLDFLMLHDFRTIKVQDINHTHMFERVILIREIREELQSVEEISMISQKSILMHQGLVATRFNLYGINTISELIITVNIFILRLFYDSFISVLIILFI